MPTAHRQHAARRRRTPRWLMAMLAVIALALVVLGGLRFLPGSPLFADAAPTWVTGSEPGRRASPSPPGPAGPRPEPGKPSDGLPVRPTTVKINAEGSWGWALLDQRTGKIYGTRTAMTSSTASLVKAWIAADFLRRTAARGDEPSKPRMKQLTLMIRDSDNNAAQALWSAVGKAASTERMIQKCDLTDSDTSSNWSLTQMSPRDIARLGACIADGRAAGRTWTSWLLKEMRLVRGVGNFGIRTVFPPKVAKQIAIKNGWVIRDEDSNNWHVNCLAIGKGWTLGIMTRYRTELDYTHGAEICEQIAQQLRR